MSFLGGLLSDRGGGGCFIRFVWLCGEGDPFLGGFGVLDVRAHWPASAFCSFGGGYRRIVAYCRMVVLNGAFPLPVCLRYLVSY